FRVHGHTVVWEDVSVDFAHALSEQFPVRPTRTAGTGPQFSFADAWAKDWFGWFNSTRAAPHEPAWWVVLGVPPTRTRDEIKRAYWHRAKVVHPDNGGTPDQFHILTHAYEQALRQAHPQASAQTEER